MSRSTKLLLAVTVLATALAACGSGTGRSAGASTGASNSSALLAFAECMRLHGVPSFPDPGGATPSGPVTSIFGIALASTIDIKSPAFQSAMSACQKLITGRAPTAGVTEAQKQAALKFAQCMRTHGVPNFPDPVFRNGRIGEGIGIGNDPNSPTFQRAQQTCGSR